MAVHERAPEGSSMMSETGTIHQTWVAFGPAGAIGTVHRVEEGYTFKLLDDTEYRGSYASLDVAKRALHAALPPGTDWPEFKEH